MSHRTYWSVGFACLCFLVLTVSLVSYAGDTQDLGENTPVEDESPPPLILELEHINSINLIPDPIPDPLGELPPAPGVPGFTYFVTTSDDDPNCAAPLADADGVPDGYVSLGAFGIPTDAGVVGDGVAFGIDWFGPGVCQFDLFGANQGDTMYFNDDGVATYTLASVFAPPPNTPIPDPTDPNNMLAAYWRDWRVVRSANRGVRLANLTNPAPVAVVIEWDSVQPASFAVSECCGDQSPEAGCNDPAHPDCEAAVCALDSFCCSFAWDNFCGTVIAGSQPECGCFDPVPTYDFEIVAFCDVDSGPGAYEYIFAYNNLADDIAPGTIGVEDALGAMGVQIAFNDVAVHDGLAICFDLVQPPVAQCQDVTVSADENCEAVASIDAGSFDPDGTFTLDQDPPAPYPLGDTEVTLVVTDNQGATDSCTATITVEDDSAPELTCSLDPSVLWPPNHQMAEIFAIVDASDNCSVPTIALDSVTSSEPDDANGNGDGHTTNDVQLGADDFHFNLRAERAGAGSGRTYTATYSATDDAGNEGSGSCVVNVPHDQSDVDALLSSHAGGDVDSVSGLMQNTGAQDASAAGENTPTGPQRVRKELRPLRRSPDEAGASRSEETPSAADGRSRRKKVSRD